MKFIPFVLLFLVTINCFAESKKAPGMTCEIVNGVCEIKNRHGKVQVRGEISNWKKEGKWIFWDSLGVKTIELNFKNDVLDGPANLYYSSFHSAEYAGNKKVETRFKEGKMDGYNRTYLPDGKLSMEFKISKGVPKTDFFNSSEIETRISDDLSFLESIIKMVDSTVQRYRESHDASS